MIKVKFESTAARDLTSIADQLQSGLSDALELIGLELAGYISEDFEKKSRGGTGAGGISWEPLSDARVKQKAKRAKGGNTDTQIGVDTGLMRATIQPGTQNSDSPFDVVGNQVTVGFGRKYAEFFDKKRPLIPDPIPSEWTDAARDIANEWVEDLWNSKIGK